MKEIAKEGVVIKAVFISFINSVSFSVSNDFIYSRKYKRGCSLYL